MSVLLRRPQPAVALQAHCRVSYLRSTIFSRSVANTAAAAEGSSTTPARGFQARDNLQGVKVRQLVQAYRNYGHYDASIDPLGSHVARNVSEHKLTLQHHGLETEDLDKIVTLDSKLLPHFGGVENRTATLRDIVKACRDTYCGTYSVECSHVEDPEQRAWLRERLEAPVPYCFSKEEKANILEDLLYVGGFERLLASKFPTEKRYGLDGAESLATCVAAVIDQSAEAHGVGHVIAGTCHRGRLALAGVVYGKPFEALFAEFMGSSGWGLDPESSGDVKTHLGNEGKHITGNGQEVRLSLIANPSHLESATPVAQGSAHATQRLSGGIRSVLNLALHGDAAFSGQGVVYESLNLARLPSYDVGGTVRILVNNQIGFTTNPESSRSTKYCSDVAKILGAPIFHVNSDSVEDVVFLARLAADWRAKFKTDCVIDFVCYRRFGHNEMDQPRFTQPLLYERIAKHDTSEEIYMRKLVSEGTFTQKEIDAKRASVTDNLNAKFNLAKDFTPKPLKNPKGWDMLPSLREQRSSMLNEASTAINSEQVALIGNVMTKCPDNFRLHKNLERILNARKAGFDSGSLDWTAAEASAFGSLLLEGHHVRVLGEDVQRGTFSQRHAVFHDQDNGATWTPLANLGPSQAPFWIHNSPLSEYGALGFEYGVTIADPNSLVMWEAQFGDFANTAQVIIDNFIVNAETKWQDRSGLVLSLPHGLDGQGPEHSSGRIERFLMLTNEDGR
ncbi:hypothetical protein K4F52_000811 [Lecanicillium sp. MT-2017a]|nr:hypothetical protein K4F52_000811 [Lecanicillium sp. MT-2017a]